VRACDQIQRRRDLRLCQIGALRSLLVGLQAQTPSLCFFFFLLGGGLLGIIMCFCVFSVTERAN
jgi:hypothetical protein